ncbi:hypothetical protein EDB85DRAFT_1889545 [Lactarius pseudohatsudake]|nr:hypothetical protein EDB85DRAFT_1889545 [Lactarius pseudohatsudake]
MAMTGIGGHCLLYEVLWMVAVADCVVGSKDTETRLSVTVGIGVFESGDKCGLKTMSFAPTQGSRCTEPSPCEFVGGGDPAGVTERREEGQVRSVRNGDSQCKCDRMKAGTGASEKAMRKAGIRVNAERREIPRDDAIRGGKMRRDDGDDLRVPAIGPDFRDKRAAREKVGDHN